MPALAAAWLIPSPLTAVSASKTHWWAHLVAGILALVGGALLAAGATIDLLVLAGQVWPVILIGPGI